MPDRAPNEIDLFAAAVELPTDQRADFLIQECGGDRELRDRVAGYLAAHERPGPLDAAAPQVEASLRALSTPNPIGAQIGRYKLRELLGEGGMGEVYVAAQTEPVRRKVAIKIIKPGMATKDVVARFEAERQALAMMDHPNIARVFDGGVTDDGQPYFVMELVQGVPITEYCDRVGPVRRTGPRTGYRASGHSRVESARRGSPDPAETPDRRSPDPGYEQSTDGNFHSSAEVRFGETDIPATGLPIRQRLELFLKVCRAVHHAHQKSIIHRDIKPSNILVAEIDGAAVPKVIDFGVAKAIDQQLNKDTVYTNVSQMIGTPLYMSPEQATLGVADVDTRSDVYSLGVLLYELLTGHTPFDREALKEADFEEMQRMIREDQPPRPSAKVSTLRADALTTVLEKRRSDPRQLGHSLRGELDWIVMKCLEKDRDRRYESASALAQDMQRHLNDEPVLARPVSRWHRMRRFIRSNRVMFATAAAVLFALATGLALATVGFLQAERRLAQAISEQRDKDVLLEILRELYDIPREDRTHSERKTVQTSLDELADEVGNRLQEHPKVEVEVRQVIGSRYVRLGNYDKAREHLTEALRLARHTYGPEHEKVADVHLAWASAVEWVLKTGAHDIGEMIDHARKAIAIYEKDGVAPQHAYFCLGFALELSPRSQDEAEKWLRKAVAVEPDSPFAIADLAVHLFAKTDHGSSEALELAKQAVATSKRRYGNQSQTTAFALAVLANAQRQLGGVYLEDAIASFREAWSIYDNDELRNEVQGHGYAFELAELYFVLGRAEEADKLLSMIEGVTAQENLWESLAESHFVRGWAHLLEEHFVAAEAELRQALEAAEHLPPMHQMRGLPTFYLVHALEGQGRTPEVQELSRVLVEFSKQYADSKYATAMILYGHAWLLLQTGLDDEQTLSDALASARRGLDLAIAWPHTKYEPHLYLTVGAALWKQGRRDEAIEMLEQGLARCQDAFPIWHARRYHVPTSRRELETVLATCYVERGNLSEAKQVYEEGISLRKNQFGDESHIQAVLARLRYGEFLLSREERGLAEAVLLDAVDDLQSAAHLERASNHLVRIYSERGDHETAAKWQAESDKHRRRREQVEPNEPGSLHDASGARPARP